MARRIPVKIEQKQKKSLLDFFGKWPGTIEEIDEMLRTNANRRKKLT